MALILCPDCSTSVSDKAKVCPKCGRTINSQPFGLAAFFYTAVIIVGVICLNTFTALPFVGFIIIGLGAFGFIAVILRKFFSL